jgi:prolyl-tRNA synthetase
MLRDRKALQAATSHDLGQSFARTYDVTFTGRDGQRAHPYATSWGASTRLIGGLVMAHGDDRGLRLPPAIAPQQAVIVPIGGIERTAATLADALDAEGIRVRVDDRDVREGGKFHEWDRKGVPVRIDVGPRDVTAGAAVVTRRDTAARETVPFAELRLRVAVLLGEIQHGLFADALAFRDAHTLATDSLVEAVEFLRAGGGFVRAGWCGGEASEERMKSETRATIRCLPLDGDHRDRPCLVCGRPATAEAIWALAY